MTTPLIEAVKKQYPKSFLAVMASEASSIVLRGNPFVDRIYHYYSPMFDRQKKLDHLTLAKNFNTVCEIQKMAFDLVLGLRGDLANIPLQRLLNGAVNISFGNHSHFAPLLTDQVAKQDHQHETSTQFDLAALAGIPGLASPEPKLYLDEADLKWSQAFLREKNIPENAPYIVISPGGGWFLNWWPESSFSTLCNKIIETYPKVYIVLVGGPGEAASAERILQRAPYKVKSAVAKTSIHQMAALMAGALFTITNDGGPMHVSTAVKTPVIALFGPSPAHRFGPLGPNNIVITKNYHCSPCPQFVQNQTPHCRDNRCMKAITVTEVFAAVKDMFKQRRVRREIAA